MTLRRRSRMLDRRRERLMAKVYRGADGKVKLASRALSIEERLDDLVREIVFVRDGHKCVSAGEGGLWCSATLQASHIIPKARGQMARWDVDNVMCQCETHHMFWWHGNDPIPPSVWAVRHFGADYIERLRVKVSLNVRRRVDKAALEIYLLRLRSQHV